MSWMKIRCNYWVRWCFFLFGGVWNVGIAGCDDGEILFGWMNSQQGEKIRVLFESLSVVYFDICILKFSGSGRFVFYKKIQNTCKNKENYLKSEFRKLENIRVDFDIPLDIFKKLVFVFRWWWGGALLAVRMKITWKWIPKIFLWGSLNI